MKTVSKLECLELTDKAIFGLAYINSVYDNYRNSVYNSKFCKTSVSHQLKIDTRSRRGPFALTLPQKIKNNSRHTSKALLIVFNFSSGWFFKENKNKNALSRLMLIFLLRNRKLH